MKDVLIAISIIFVGVILWFLPIYFLWNWLMPELFNLKEITITQSAGLLILSSILLKSNGSNKK